jgi:hypothetical protein
VTVKTTYNERPFLLPKSQRASFWREHPSFPPWVWIFEAFEYAFDLWRQRFLDATRADGLRVQFIEVIGSEYISADSVDLDTRPWSCRHTITINVSRPADYVDVGSDLPRKLRGCTPWKTTIRPRKVSQLLETVSLHLKAAFQQPKGLA